MYRILANSEFAKTVYVAFVRKDDPDYPEPERGHRLKQLKRLNELLDENIDEWLYHDELSELEETYNSLREEDELGIADLFYELFALYIPVGSVVSIRIVDKYGNVDITVEE